jgi:glutamate synthase (NADPH/NADH) small chain
MGNPRGFLDLRERKVTPLRPVSERVQDFSDVHSDRPMREQMDEVISQSSRCMDCGVPFCHFSCPLGNLIPEWNDLASKGSWKLAYDRLSATNNFPEFTGRICPALCESGCVLGSVDPAVTVKNTEVTISDVAFNREYVQPVSADYSSGKTVAIVGSGPSGLAAAQQLARVGHTVVVYEKNNMPGGLLRYGIPNFKLDKSLIDRRLKQLEAEGIRFRCGVKVGGDGENDVSWDYLKVRFDVILIAIGTEVPNDLRIPGRDCERDSDGGLGGVYQAMEFLPQATKAAIEDQPLQISAQGKRVLVVGGGDTGSDCLGTSLRHGAEFVTTLQVMPKPGKNRSDVKFYGGQPWPTYAMLDNPSTSVEEGDQLGKSEVLYETTVVELIGDADGGKGGNVKTAVLADVKWNAGNPSGGFEVLEDTRREIPVDLVLISVGFRGPDTTSLAAQLGVETDQRTRIVRDENFQTNVENVFVCGDAGRGQSLVVWAIAEGRSAAAAVDKYLTGSSELPAPVKFDQQPLRA